MDGFFPILNNSLAIKIVVGVLPVPPKYIVPTQIIGILKTLSFVMRFFTQIKNW